MITHTNLKMSSIAFTYGKDEFEIFVHQNTFQLIINRNGLTIGKLNPGMVASNKVYSNLKKEFESFCEDNGIGTLGDDRFMSLFVDTIHTMYQCYHDRDRETYKVAV